MTDAEQIVSMTAGLLGTGFIVQFLARFIGAAWWQHRDMWRSL